MDCTAILQHELNIALICEGGVFVFFCHLPGIYDVCVSFLPGWRGCYAVDAARQALEFMFLHTDCMTIMLRIPDDNKGSRIFARHLGAKVEFHRGGVWPVKDGRIGMTYASIRYEDWALSNPGISEYGEIFLSRLFEERNRLGFGDVDQDQDPENLRFIGAFAKTAYAGQLDKAVILYNRFAAFALLPFISLVSRSPAMVEIGGTLIQIRDGSFKAILHR